VCRPSTIYMYSSKLARSRPRSVSLSSLNLVLQLHLQTRSITASKCISKLARLRPPQVHLQTPSITISDCISKFTRSRPPSVSPNTLDYRLQVHRSRPPSVFPNTLDYRLQVHLQSRSITASECISEFTRLSFSGAPRIALKRHLQPIQIYRV